MPARILAITFLLLATACGAEPQAVPSQTGDGADEYSEAGLELVPLEISSGGQVHRFTVEVARTPEEQARGLMFRQNLGLNQGMLFPFDPPRPASFWMKNTLIPLDMIFIRADGTIAEIAQNTVPHSLEQVAVSEPVAAVLEIAGGRSAELGLRPGDRVTWRQ